MRLTSGLFAPALTLSPVMWWLRTTMVWLWSRRKLLSRPHRKRRSARTTKTENASSSRPAHSASTCTRCASRLRKPHLSTSTIRKTTDSGHTQCCVSAPGCRKIYFRGWTKSPRGHNSENKERHQNYALSDRERRLGLRRCQFLQRRHLLKRLHDQNEHVEIKRDQRGRDVDPSPRPGQVLHIERIE